MIFDDFIITIEIYQFLIHNLICFRHPGTGHRSHLKISQQNSLETISTPHLSKAWFLESPGHHHAHKGMHRIWLPCRRMWKICVVSRSDYGVTMSSWFQHPTCYKLFSSNGFCIQSINMIECKGSSKVIIVTLTDHWKYCVLIIWVEYILGIEEFNLRWALPDAISDCGTPWGLAAGQGL